MPSHVQAHPPGMVVVLLALERLGLATPGWIAAFQLVGGAASVPAVLLAVRDVADERSARRAAPFVAFSSIALTWSSGDAIFLAVGAWAVALLVLATGREGRRSDALALGGGLFAAAAVFLSYGIVLLGIVPAAVAWRRRRLRPIDVGGALVAALALAALGGFWWLDGLAVTRSAYAESLARVRPYGYFLVANMAPPRSPSVPLSGWVSYACATGACGCSPPARRSRSCSPTSRVCRRPRSSASGCRSFPGSWSRRGAFAHRRPRRRAWLGLQVGWALVVQTMVYSPW